MTPGLMLEDRLAAAQARVKVTADAWADAQTDRNRLVLEAIDAGWSSAKIAEHLGLTRQRIDALREQLADAKSPAGRRARGLEPIRPAPRRDRRSS